MTSLTALQVVISTYLNKSIREYSEKYKGEDVEITKDPYSPNG